MEVNQKIEEGLLEYTPIDLKKVGSLLILCFKNLLLGLWKYFRGLKIGFLSTPNVLFWKSTNSLKRVYLVNKCYIFALQSLKCLLGKNFIYIFGSTFIGLNIGFGSTSKGLKMDFLVTPKVEMSLIGLIKAESWLQDV